MSLQDPLSDLFSRIRNAQMRYKPIVSSPVSKLRENILEVLKKEGYRIILVNSNPATIILSLGIIVKGTSI